MGWFRRGIRRSQFIIRMLIIIINKSREARRFVVFLPLEKTSVLDRQRCLLSSSSWIKIIERLSLQLRVLSGSARANFLVDLTASVHPKVFARGFHFLVWVRPRIRSFGNSLTVLLTFSFPSIIASRSPGEVAIEPKDDCRY